MRILLTADPMLPVPPAGYGGIERIVDALVRFYQEQGHTVGLLAHPASTSPAAERFGWPGTSRVTAWDALRKTCAIWRTSRHFQPDVLHSFSRLGYLTPRLVGHQPTIMSYQRHTGPRQIARAVRLGGHSIRFTGCSEFICGLGRPGGGEWTAIPNFVELDRIDFVPAVPADAPLVFLSRVESIKGADLAIAVARQAGRRLLIAGNHATSSPEFDYWTEKIAPHLGHDGIEYVGEVGDAQKNTLLGGAAALIVPIQWDEPFGIVFAEALAAGTPVISCARGALPEIITPERTGFFISGVDDGAAAVRRLPELSRAACRSEAEARFSVAVCGRQYLELYARCLQ
jgi:glycosyltransferase involved in cell wall biosynthesis